MASGRCSGCGRADSLRKISTHIVSCPDYAELFQSDPSKALDPAAEHRRFQTEDRSPEARAEQRGERLLVRFADINRQQAASTARWAKPPSILD